MCAGPGHMCTCGTLLAMGLVEVWLEWAGVRGMLGPCSAGCPADATGWLRQAERGVGECVEVPGLSTFLSMLQRLCSHGFFHLLYVTQYNMVELQITIFGCCAKIMGVVWQELQDVHPVHVVIARRSVAPLHPVMLLTRRDVE